MTDVPDEVQRWTAKRKAAIVLSIVKGETSAAETARVFVNPIVDHRDGRRVDHL